MTLIPASSAATGIHWPTAQATSLQNIVFQMSSALGTQHQGVLIEQGSGGFMTDLVFNGGLYGGNWGNQQFTMRNMTFNNVVVGINMIWDWGWTFKGMTCKLEDMNQAVKDQGSSRKLTDIQSTTAPRLST